MTIKFTESPAKYRQRYLECKSWGHGWKHNTDFHIVRNTAGQIIQFTRQAICANCQTERHDVFNRRMEVVSRKYVYPDGYQTAGEHVIDVTTARGEFVRRVLVKNGDKPDALPDDADIQYQSV